MDDDLAIHTPGNISQTDSETIWSVGDSCRAKWSGDNRYYSGVIKKLCRHPQGLVSALVKFSDYDSDDCEEVGIPQLQKVPKGFGKKPHNVPSGSQNAGDKEACARGFFKPLTSSEESSRLEAKYGHESESEDDSSQTSWVSPSYQTKGKVSDWILGSPAKTQTPLSQRRKVQVAFGGSPRKRGRTGKTNLQGKKTGISSAKGSQKSSNMKPSSTTQTEMRNVTNMTAKHLLQEDKTSHRNVFAESETSSKTLNTVARPKQKDFDTSLRPRAKDLKLGEHSVDHPGSDGVDDAISVEENDNERFEGFDEDDMEKPKFSFAAPSAKAPYYLDEDKKVQVPAALNQYLRDYQREGIRFLYVHYAQGRGAILGDDMGLGKTVQVIGFLSALLGKEGNRMDVMRQKPRFIRMMSDTPGLHESRKCLPFLIIGPGSVLYNWLEELETWGHFTVRKYHGADKASCLTEVMRGKVEVVVTTFETFRDNVESLNAVDWEAVIVDEVHRIKGMKAQTTRALRTTPCLCRYGLTGTALQNNMSELWCILDWAQPDVLGSQEEFEEEFVKPIEQGQKHDATKRELAEARRKKEAFAQVRSQMMIRRTKKIIADQLPQKTDRVVFCRLSPLQVSVYKAVLKHEDMISILNMHHPCTCGSGASRGKCCHQKTRSGKKVSSVMFTFMHLLLKIANHVALLIPHARTSPEQQQQAQQLCDLAFKEHPEFVSLTKEAAFRTLSDPQYCGKMKVLQGMLSVFAKSHSKVLVFSYSTRLLDILEQHVISEGHMYRRIDGKVTGRRRQEIVREFNSDPNLFLCLISTKAGGLGLNMTGANKVVIFDPNWNPSHDLQAQDRAYRIGQRRDVEVFRLISAGTIEENIYLRQIYKQQLDNVAVGTENARRYFHGIQGDADNKGELFGIKNMFQLRTGDSCLTMDILHRNAKVEAGIAGNDMADYIPSSHEQKAAKADASVEDDSDLDVMDDGSSDEEAFHGLRGLFDSTASDAEDESPQTPSKSRQLSEDPLPSTSRKKGRNVRTARRAESAVDSFSDELPSPRRKKQAARRTPTKIEIVESPRNKRSVKDTTSSREATPIQSPWSVMPKKCPQNKNSGVGTRKQGEEGTSSSSRMEFDDSLKTPSFTSVSSVFEDCGVIHVHDNPAVVGASRVEDHMSRCAMQDVFELQTNSQAPALLCDPLSQSSSEEEAKPKVARGKSQRGKSARGRTPAKDHNSSRMVEHGRWHILVGQTPSAIKRKHWNHLKEAQDCVDDVNLALRVVTASPEGRMAMLRDFYKHCHGDAIHQVLDDILTIPPPPVMEEDVGGTSCDGRKSERRGRGSKSTPGTVEKTKGQKGQRKVTEVTLPPNKKTPVKRRQPDRGLVFDGMDDTEVSHSPRKRPLENVDSNSDSFDLDIGAKISPSKPRGTPQKQPAVTQSSVRSQRTVQAPVRSVKQSTKRSASRAPTGTHILDELFDSVDGDVRYRRGEDVEELLQELGEEQNKPAQLRNPTKSEVKQVSLFEAKRSAAGGVLRGKTVAEEGPSKHKGERVEVSMLDDIFSDSTSCGPTRRKPPPKNKHKMGTGNNASTNTCREKINTTSPGTSKPLAHAAAGTVYSTGGCMHKGVNLASTSTASDLDSSKNHRSPNIFSDLMNNSTLQDDSLDCFGDSSLWKKRKKVCRIPPKKVDRLLQETKDDYEELFETGRLVPKRKDNKSVSSVQAHVNRPLDSKSRAGDDGGVCEMEEERYESGCIDPSGSLFS